MAPGTVVRWRKCFRNIQWYLHEIHELLQIWLISFCYMVETWMNLPFQKLFMLWTADRRWLSTGHRCLFWAAIHFKCSRNWDAKYFSLKDTKHKRCSANHWLVVLLVTVKLIIAPSAKHCWTWQALNPLHLTLKHLGPPTVSMEDMSTKGDRIAALLGKLLRTARCFCSCYELRSSQALKCMALKLAFLPTNSTLLILAKQKNGSGKSSRRHGKMWVVAALHTVSRDFLAVLYKSISKAFPNLRSSR